MGRRGGKGRGLYEIAAMWPINKFYERRIWLLYGGMSAVPGRFGAGQTASCRASIVNVRFPQLGEKKFVPLDPMERGFLCYGKDGPE